MYNTKFLSCFIHLHFLYYIFAFCFHSFHPVFSVNYKFFGIWLLLGYQKRGIILLVITSNLMWITVFSPFHLEHFNFMIVDFLDVLSCTQWIFPFLVMLFFWIWLKLGFSFAGPNSELTGIQAWEETWKRRIWTSVCWSPYFRY